MAGRPCHHRVPGPRQRLLQRRHAGPRRRWRADRARPAPVPAAAGARPAALHRDLGARDGRAAPDRDRGSPRRRCRLLGPRPPRDLARRAPRHDDLPRRRDGPLVCGGGRQHVVDGARRRAPAAVRRGGHRHRTGARDPLPPGAAVPRFHRPGARPRGPAPRPRSDSPDPGGARRGLLPLRRGRDAARSRPVGRPRRCAPARGARRLYARGDRPPVQPGVRLPLPLRGGCVPGARVRGLLGDRGSALHPAEPRPHAPSAPERAARVRGPRRRPRAL